MICNTSNALMRLFDEAGETLPTETLEWLGNLGESAELEARNIAETLGALATLMTGEDVLVKPGDESLSAILWGLADHAGNVAAAIRVSSEAAYLAEKRNTETPMKDESLRLVKASQQAIKNPA